MNSFFEKPAALGNITLHSASMVLNAPFRFIALGLYGVDSLLTSGQPHMCSMFTLSLAETWLNHSLEKVKENWNIVRGHDADDEVSPNETTALLAS